MWQYEYTPNDQLKAVILPTNQRFAYWYDGAGRLARIDAPGNPASQMFRYDALGRLTMRSRGATMDTSTGAYLPLRSWTYAYQDGWATQTDPDGNTTRTLTDPQGRVRRKTFTPASTSATSVLEQLDYTYSHDRLANVVETMSGREQYRSRFDYDTQDRLSMRWRERRASDSVNTWTVDSRVTYVYKADDLGPGAGLPIRIRSERQFDAQGTAASLAIVAYDYDAIGRVSKITGRHNETRIGWEGLSQRPLELTGDGLTERRCYDGTGRVSSIVSGTPTTADTDFCHSAPHTLVQRFDYTYDGRGNRLTESVTHGTGQPELTAYGYDTADRLTGVQYPDGKRVLYELNGAGSRQGEKTLLNATATDLLTHRQEWLGPDAFTLAQQPTQHVRFDVDPSEYLTGIRDGNSTNEATPLGLVTTNGQGQLTKLVYGENSHKYEWDVAGRMVKAHVLDRVTEIPVSATEYGYDHEGFRVWSKQGNATSQMVWSGGELLEEVAPDGKGTLYARHGQLVAAAGTQRVLHDDLGSITGRWNGSAIVGRTQYDAFGAFLPGSVSPQGPPSLAYAGLSWDEPAGLHYAQQRWYAPALGRFLSEDSVGAESYLTDPVGMNGFAYAANNPLRYADPTGQLHQVKDSFWLSYKWVLDRGDTAESIAAGRNHLFSASELAAINPGIDWAHVKGGEEIKIPKLSSTEMAYRFQYVAAASKFATLRRAGAPVQEIQAALRAMAKLDEDFIQHGVTKDFRDGVVLPLTLQAGATIIMAPVAAASATVRIALAVKGAASGGVAIGEAITGEEINVNASAVANGNFDRVLSTRKLDGKERAWKLAEGVVEVGMSVLAVKAEMAREGCVGSECTLPGQCFVAGTLVHTVDGDRPIELIREGDLVWSRDTETKELALKRVAQLFVTPDRLVGTLTIVRDDGKEESFGVTPNHPFYVEGKGWLEAANLMSGDVLFSSKGGWVRVKGGEWAEEPTTTYNFEVEDFHTYFVGQTRVWVHNTGDCPKPSEPYSRRKHYGKTPTKSDRNTAGASSDEVLDHDPPLVKRYYEGDPSTGEKPGFMMTQEERLASARDRARMQLQSKSESNRQGGEMKSYSMRKKDEFDL